MHCHTSFDNTLSGGPTAFPLKKQPQIGGAVLTVRRIGRRNRAGAGAGATPVSVAAIRHDTFLAGRVSLVGRSRTCPSSRSANPNTIHSQKQSHEQRVG